MISKGNRVKFARFVLLVVSKEAKTWLPGLLHWQERQWKNSWRQGLTNCTKRSTKVVKELLADYVKEKKLREPKELAQTLKTFYVEVRKKEFVQCIIKQLLDSVFVTSRIIKISVRVISLSLPLRLITPKSTLIILDITKTSSNNCLITFDKGCWLAYETQVYKQMWKLTMFITADYVLSVIKLGWPKN